MTEQRFILLKDSHYFGVAKVDIEHVWVDCDGTLYVPSPELVKRVEDHVCTTLSDRVKKPVEDVRKEYREGRKRYGTCVLAIKQLFGLQESEARTLYNEPTISDLISPDPLLYDIIFSIISQGIDVSIYTNSKRTKLLSILGGLKLSPDLFKYLMTVEEGGGKPAGFDQLLMRSQCSPSQILFVGDSEKADIEPSRRVGMNTLLVRSEKPAIERDYDRGTFHFKRNKIYELADVVESLKIL